MLDAFRRVPPSRPHAAQKHLRCYRRVVARVKQGFHNAILSASQRRAPPSLRSEWALNGRATEALGGASPAPPRPRFPLLRLAVLCHHKLTLMRWKIQTTDPAAVERLERELGVPPLIARLLVQRRLDDPAAAERFLHPALDQLHDPFRMADMGVAVERALVA